MVKLSSALFIWAQFTTKVAYEHFETLGRKYSLLKVRNPRQLRLRE